ncbi:hypothetical protein BH09VER1_BH09VER1_23870 [soil metagenome]
MKKYGAVLIIGMALSASLSFADGDNSTRGFTRADGTSVPAHHTVSSIGTATDASSTKAYTNPIVTTAGAKNSFSGQFSVDLFCSTRR